MAKILKHLQIVATFLYTSYIYAQLRSLAYDKDVRVRYSTDNWATYEEVQGTFNYSFPDSAIESWVVSVPATQAFEYAISYKVNGTTYWDNNFGANYTFLTRQPKN